MSQSVALKQALVLTLTQGLALALTGAGDLWLRGAVHGLPLLIVFLAVTWWRMEAMARTVDWEGEWLRRVQASAVRSGVGLGLSAGLLQSVYLGLQGAGSSAHWLVPVLVSVILVGLSGLVLTLCMGWPRSHQQPEPGVPRPRRRAPPQSSRQARRDAEVRI